MHEWNRRQLWSSTTAPHTRHAVCAVIGAAAAGALAIGFLGASVSCLELYVADDHVHRPAAAASAECLVDEDCALRPARITCCGECEAAPPFGAAKPPTRLCDPPVCAPVPAGCEARAVCREGSCRAEATRLCAAKRW